MSKLFVDEIQPKTTGGIIGVKGHVLQVKYFQLTTSQIETYGTSNIDQAITNFNVSITPRNTSSIIKLESNVMHEWENGSQNTMWFFYRNTTKLGNTDSDISNRRSGISNSLISFWVADNDSSTEFTTLTYFDQPQTTSAITYKLGVTSAGTNDLFINRTKGTTDNINYERGVSFISATEIGG